MIPNVCVGVWVVRSCICVLAFVHEYCDAICMGSVTVDTVERLRGGDGVVGVTEASLASLGCSPVPRGTRYQLID